MAEREPREHQLLEQEVRECQEQQRFPDQMSLADFIQLLDTPDLLPVLRQVLTEILQSNGSSYASEYAGKHTTPEITKYYFNAIKVRPTETERGFLLLNPGQRNLRHEALALAHTRFDKPRSHQLAHLLSLVAEKLGFQINREAAAGEHQDGDYHILAKYLSEHLAELTAAFLKEPQTLPEMMQRVRRGSEVEINVRGAARIVAQLEFIFGQINLDDLNLSKKKLAEPKQLNLEPENLHTVVKKFKALFIDADFATNLNPILKEYGFDAADVTPEVINTIKHIFGSVELILLATLKSTGGPLRDNLLADLGALDNGQRAVTLIEVQNALASYLQEACDKPDQRNRRFLDTPTISEGAAFKPQEILDIIATRITAQSPRSAGVAEVLYKQALQTEDPEQKAVLTKLMHLCTQLVSPQVGQEHNLKSMVSIQE